MIRTVTGALSEKIKGNILMHEHICCVSNDMLCVFGFRGNNLRVSLFKGVVKTGNMPDYAQSVSDNSRF